MFKIGANNIRYTVEEVRHFIEVDSNSDCKLVSSVYLNSKEKLELKCPCGNNFHVSYSNFKSETKRKRKCNKCCLEKRGVSRRLKYEDIKLFIEVESQSGCLLLSKEYKGTSKPIEIKCKCSNIFSTTWTQFKNRNKRQCNNCGNAKSGSKEPTSIEAIKEFIEVESNSGCLLISDKHLLGEKIKIKCPCGNHFKTKFTTFKTKDKRKCNTCKIEEGAIKKRKSSDSFAKEFYEIWGDSYTLLSDYVKDTVKIKIRCNTCDSEYYTHPSSVTRRETGCDKCSASKGERTIQRVLRKYGVDFVSEKSYLETKKLRFDFLVHNQFLLEYDGEFHFKVATFSKDEKKMKDKLIKQQRNDKTKNKYCIDNGIPLIRIPYWEFNNIEELVVVALMYYQLVEQDKTYNKNKLLKYIVDEEWNQKEYAGRSNTA